jgi:hypothetical protein
MYVQLIEVNTLRCLTINILLRFNFLAIMDQKLKKGALTLEKKNKDFPSIWPIYVNFWKPDLLEVVSSTIVVALKSRPA